METEQKTAQSENLLWSSEFELLYNCIKQIFAWTNDTWFSPPPWSNLPVWFFFHPIFPQFCGTTVLSGAAHVPHIWLQSTFRRGCCELAACVNSHNLRVFIRGTSFVLVIWLSNSGWLRSWYWHKMKYYILLIQFFLYLNRWERAIHQYTFLQFLRTINVTRRATIRQVSD